MGVLVGDWRRASHGLRVKDEAFAEHYVRMYEKVTGVKPKITLDKEGFYNTRENGAVEGCGAYISEAILAGTFR